MRAYVRTHVRMHGSIEELPLKTTVYGTLVALLNTHSPDFVEGVRTRVCACVGA
jgi:hypothetical protein